MLLEVADAAGGGSGGGADDDGDHSGRSSSGSSMVIVMVPAVMLAPSALFDAACRWPYIPFLQPCRNGKTI